MRYAGLSCLLACSLYATGQDDFPDYNVDLVAHVDYTAGSTERGNDVWGYVGADGTEYAIAGSTAATYIYSLADPSNPALIARIEGSQSIWRDFKTYGEYIYAVADQGDDGILVIDMTGAPAAVEHEFYRPILPAFDSAQLLRSHNLYISAQGTLVLAGANVGGGRPLLFDVAADATAPPYVGAAREAYAHDVWAEGGLLLSSDIYLGELGVHTYTTEGEVALQGSRTTPNRFTHNAWPNAERSEAYTTDERAGSFVGAFDIADRNSPEELDRFRPNATFTSGSIPHNTHVTDADYLVTSWYRDGVVVTDAARPGNLVEVGRYDTYRGGGSGFDGAWGAFPFLPSGLLLVSDIQLGLFVLRPNYQRGCYFEGQVVDAVTGAPIPDADVDIAGLRAQSTTTDIGGAFATGIYEEGTYRVEVTHPGYLPEGFDAVLARGELTERIVRLRRLADAEVTVTVVDLAGEPIAGAEHVLEYRGDVGDGDGPRRSRYDLIAGAWGYRTTALEDVEIVEGEPAELTIALPGGIYDDFALGAAWTVTSTASSGRWERVVPIGTRAEGAQVQVDRDVAFDFGGFAYVTGSGFGEVGAGDVDDGVTRLTSPPFDGTGLDSGRLEFYYSYYVGGGGGVAPDDELTVEIANGSETARLVVADAPSDGFEPFRSPPIGTLLPMSDAMTISFVAGDEGNPHLVEAAIDAVTITTAERPDVNFTGASGCAPLVVEANALDRPLPADTRWRFEGAAVPDQRGSAVEAVYERPGTYDVTLTVLGDDGGRATFLYADAVEVSAPPEASFYTEQVGDTVFFFNESPGGGTAAWAFGDGATSTELFAAHAYASPGDYEVTLTVANDCGTDALTQTVTYATPSSTRSSTPARRLRIVVNPVGERLQLDYPLAAGDDATAVRIYSLAGGLLLSETLTPGGRHGVDVSTLGPGLYLVAVGRAVGRFVVAR